MHANGLRGFSAGTDLAAGDVLVSVPEALLISQDTAHKSDLVSSPILMCMKVNIP